MRYLNNDKSIHPQQITADSEVKAASSDITSDSMVEEGFLTVTLCTTNYNVGSVKQNTHYKTQVWRH